MALCDVCKRPQRLATQVLGICGPCLRERAGDYEQRIRRAHERSRGEFDLPAEPPRAPDGAVCTQCVNACRMEEGEAGFCQARRAQGGEIVGGEEQGVLHFYYDPLPTNCVAMPWCGGVGEVGTHNLAVFSQFCTFDCLFCQNWHFRNKRTHERPITAEELAAAVDPRTTCICYFGGDPTPQLPFFLRASRLALEQAAGRTLRICWETNGSMSPALAEEMMELSLVSGGTVKFDLKAWSEEVHLGLCGVSNKRTLENFRRLARFIAQRPEPPPLVASTLLVPGYVDAYEVRHIAQFIAELDPNIPYALLAFYPQFFTPDLPTTSRAHAMRCLEAAHEAGLLRVRLGNEHLLWSSDAEYEV